MQRDMDVQALPTQSAIPSLHTRGMRDAHRNAMPLPGDVVFEILKRCQYRAVISIRLVSKACCELTKNRLVWVLLVREYIYGDDEKYSRYVIEKPIGSYSTSELEALVNLWASAERFWLNPRNDSPLQPSLQFKLNTPYFGHYRDISTSFLVPGGNFFVEFGVDASALYYDLHSAALTPHVLIPPVTGRFIRNLTIFKPRIDSSVETLSLHTGICFLDGQHDRWTVTLWRVSVLSDGTSSRTHRLQAEQAVSLFFEHPPDATLYMEAMDLSRDEIGLYSSISPRAARAEPPCRAVTLVTLSDVSNGSGDFKRRVVYVDENFTEVNILPRQWLLVHSTTRTLLFEYCHSPAYTHTPIVSDILSSVSTHAIQDLRPVEYLHPEVEDTESIISPLRVTQCHRNRATHTIFQQTVLIGLSDGKSILQPIEIRFRDGRSSFEGDPPYVSVFDRIPSNLDFRMDSLKFLTPSHGFRVRLLEFNKKKMKFNVYMAGDDERSFTIAGSVAVGLPRRRFNGIIHSIDEGTGRVLMYDLKPSVVSVFDLIVC